MTGLSGELEPAHPDMGGFIQPLQMPQLSLMFYYSEIACFPCPTAVVGTCYMTVIIVLYSTSTGTIIHSPPGSATSKHSGCMLAYRHGIRW